MWLEKCELQVLYSNGTRNNQKVITVFVGASDTPCRRLCETVLAMDPEIEAPVVVIPFGGLQSDWTEDDDLVARQMILRTTPGFAGDSFSFRCTRIIDVLLIKVLVARTGRDQSRVAPSYDGWDLPLN
jgi:hypothetical protein